VRCTISSRARTDHGEFLPEVDGLFLNLVLVDMEVVSDFLRCIMYLRFNMQMV